MSLQALTARPTPAQLRAARRQLIEAGAVPSGTLDPLLADSWLRSREFGLEPIGRPAGAPHASAAQLARALEQRHELVAHARPAMEYLFEQTRDSDCMVILADPHGMLLHALGDAEFVGRAERVALRPGAVWHEQWRGTNAIGTALAECAPVVVHASEHYLERNGFLTCAAAPVVDSTGRLLGVLDVSGDQRGYHRHTLGLVRSAARMIEHRLFETRHGAVLRLRLHAQPEGLGTLTEALLAFNDDGWLLGANDAARQTFQLGGQDTPSLRLGELLDLDMDRLHAWCRQGGHAPRAVRSADGTALWARVDAGRLSVPMAGAIGGAVGGAIGGATGGTASGAPTTHPARTAQAADSSAAPATDALAALDTGDAALQAVIGRARRVLDKPIALLLQGESGTGKEVLARAAHASGPRRASAFVAVNCAALPENLIEAELFGYRPGAFTGASRDGAPGRIREADRGTLFLDEIGDMPLPLQARLLRVLQEREVTPLGGGKPVPVDFRLICATHRRLRDEMDAGRFREDLYYRLNGLTLQLPPLRERSDLADLAQRMLAEVLPGRDVRLNPEVARALARYRWPGNLRQMANALRTAGALLGDDEPQIDWHHLPDDLAEDLRSHAARPAGTGSKTGAAGLTETGEPPESLRQLSAQAVAHIVQATQGNLSEAARRLGISRNTLYRKLRP